MENLIFKKYHMTELLRISDLSTANYFSGVRNYSTPDHVHEEAWEFVFCAKGKVRCFVNGEESELGANQVLFNSPKTVHHLLVERQPTTMLILSFVCTSEVMKLLQNRVIHVNASQRQMLSVITQELANAFELTDGQLDLHDFRSSANPVLGAEQMITCYLEGFFIGLLRDVTNQEEKRWSASALEKALENRLAEEIKQYVEKHLSERITLAILSEQVHYSRSYIAEQFQRSTGMTVTAYISERRIERAKELLTEGNMTVSQISESLGFSSVQYFSKCFRDAVGSSPSAYTRYMRQLLFQ